ncbi:MAG TPA: ATP synthase F1 subunit epsilon [Candidatus Saccharimonadales bacterium]|nr:ATP synthase F1 subunit epsilon [Candidatus Saccharimonadales bacterium]
MAELTFELVTPEGVKFTEEAYEVLLPTPGGQIGILPHHMPLVTLAVPGVIGIRRRAEDPDSRIEHFATSGGFVEVDGQRLRLLADTAEHADDIDELRAQEALQRARELHHTAEDHVTLADATALIERNTARLKVAEIRRRHRRS